MVNHIPIISGNLSQTSGFWDPNTAVSNIYNMELAWRLHFIYLVLFFFCLFMHGAHWCHSIFIELMPISFRSWSRYISPSVFKNLLNFSLKLPSRSGSSLLEPVQGEDFSSLLSRYAGLLSTQFSRLPLPTDILSSHFFHERRKCDKQNWSDCQRVVLQERRDQRTGQSELLRMSKSLGERIPKRCQRFVPRH